MAARRGTFSSAVAGPRTRFNLWRETDGTRQASGSDWWQSRVGVETSCLEELLLLFVPVFACNRIREAVSSTISTRLPPVARVEGRSWGLIT